MKRRRPVCAECGAKIDVANALRIVAETQLGPVARRIAEVLAEHFGKWLTRDRIAAAVYADDPNGGPLSGANDVSVLVLQRIRPRLAKRGLAIDGVRRVGLRMRWSDKA